MAHTPSHTNNAHRILGKCSVICTVIRNAKSILESENLRQVFDSRNAACGSGALFRARRIPDQPCLLKRVKANDGWFQPLFHLQVNGEALWQWRRLSPNEMFDALQSNLAKIGYILTSCSLVRTGTVIYGRVAYLVKKVNLATNCNVRRPVRSEYWCCIALALQ